MKLHFAKIREHECIDNIKCTLKSLLFHGITIDDRSETMVNGFIGKCEYHLEMIYQNKTNSFLLNKENKKSNELKDSILSVVIKNDIEHIIIEGTSLGYTELLILLLSLVKIDQSSIKVTIVYAEPLEYTKTKQDDLNDDTYELSEDYHPHKYIKPFMLNEPHDFISSEQAILVTFIGFEENRLGRVLEKNNDDNKYNEFIYVIPVPGFKFGWENISLSKHYHLIDNYKEIHYAPADDPYETYRVLEKIVENHPDRKIVIMPLGTKPCTIATSIFLVNKKIENKYDIATKFDFPIKSKNRSKGISKVYEYILKLT